MKDNVYKIVAVAVLVLAIFFTLVSSFSPWNKIENPISGDVLSEAQAGLSMVADNLFVSLDRMYTYQVIMLWLILIGLVVLLWKHK